MQSETKRLLKTTKHVSLSGVCRLLASSEFTQFKVLALTVGDVFQVRFPHCTQLRFGVLSPVEMLSFFIYFFDLVALKVNSCASSPV